MVLEKIRKSQGITGLIISLLIVIGLFFGCYFYIADNYESANVTVSSEYTATYARLNQSQSDLSAVTDDMKSSFSQVVEADSVYQVAINGFKGLGNLLKIPVALIDLTYNVFESFLDLISVIPGWVIALISIGIITFVVFLIVKVWSGGTTSL